MSPISLIGLISLIGPISPISPISLIGPISLISLIGLISPISLIGPISPIIVFSFFNSQFSLTNYTPYGLLPFPTNLSQHIPPNQSPHRLGR